MKSGAVEEALDRYIREFPGSPGYAGPPSQARMCFMGSVSRGLAKEGMRTRPNPRARRAFLNTLTSASLWSRDSEKCCQIVTRRAVTAAVDRRENKFGPTHSKSRSRPSNEFQRFEAANPTISLPAQLQQMARL